MAALFRISFSTLSGPELADRARRQLLQVLAGRRRRVRDPSARFLLELQPPIAQVANPNPQRSRDLGLGLLAQSSLANRLELELPAVPRVQLAFHDTHPPRASIALFGVSTKRGEDQTGQKQLLVLLAQIIVADAARH
jgi:hypothetical protein